MTPSKVYIVGAGPGDPELLTVKAARVISEADIIFYDRLISEKILALAPAGCRKVFVGKKDGVHHVPQGETNRLVVAAAHEFQRVVRLKGGDPFVFGRGGEEEMVLAEAQVPFETVPGISSSMAVPAYAGIPLTYRNLSRSFAVVTGHLANDFETPLNWEAFVKIDTLVVLMGIGRRQAIALDLIEAGRDAQDPVAFVEKGATQKQRVVETNLAEVARGEVQVNSPAVMVIGPVVRLRKKLKWFAELETNPETMAEKLETCIF